MAEPTKGKVDVLFQKFKKHYAPKEIIAVWRHRHHTRVQGETETIYQYVTDLRIISKNCRFNTFADEMLRNRVVCGVHKLKKRLSRNNELTLIKALSMSCE